MTECDHIVGLIEPHGMIHEFVSLESMSEVLADFNLFEGVFHTRFHFCPYCGSKIDWRDIEQQIRAKCEPPSDWDTLGNRQ